MGTELDGELGGGGVGGSRWGDAAGDVGGVGGGTRGAANDVLISFQRRSGNNSMMKILISPADN